jgi:uncharacterized protein YutE (UPF0331/DUF86 family)
MVSLEKIIQKFQQLDEFLGLLRKISKTPIKLFLKDKLMIGSAKYYLQVSIECCLDVTNHIIASEHFRAPKDYADSFMIIEEEGLISGDQGQRLRQMAKFRNRLVHLYGEIDDAYVYEFMKEDLKDIEEFKSIIIKRYKQ